MNDDLTLAVRHPRRGTVLEFDLETITDVRDHFVFLDADGEGRLMVSASELEELQRTMDRGGVE